MWLVSVAMLWGVTLVKVLCRCVIYKIHSKINTFVVFPVMVCIFNCLRMAVVLVRGSAIAIIIRHRFCIVSRVLELCPETLKSTTAAYSIHGRIMDV